MISRINFRPWHQVVFVSFCVVFVCSYRGGNSRYDRQEETTEPSKFEREFTEHDPGDGSKKTKPTTFVKRAIKGNVWKCKYIRYLDGTRRLLRRSLRLPRGK